MRHTVSEHAHGNTDADRAIQQETVYGRIQTNQRVNNRTRGQAKQIEECCVELKTCQILTCHLKMQQTCSYPRFTADEMLFFSFLLESNNGVILSSSLTEIYITHKIFPNTDTRAVCTFIQIDWFVGSASLCLFLYFFWTKKSSPSLCRYEVISKPDPPKC